MTVTTESPSRVIVCRGALATERRLLAEIDAFAPTSPDDLILPVRVIVPSRSLRLHLLRRLVRERRAVAGIVIQTIGGLAREINERAGEAAPVRAAAFEVAVRRFARREPALAAELDELEQGYDAVLGAVRDLVDAGFTPEHEDGVLERVDDLRPVVPSSNLGRAAALVRITARSLDFAEVARAHPQAALTVAAADALRSNGSEALPTRRLLVHGFADLTGVAADLLRALLEVVGGSVLLDRVPDPLATDRDDAGNAFLERFDVLVGGLERELDPARPEPAAVSFAEAPDVESEARWVADTVRSAIAGDVEPESVGVVARRLSMLGPPLRRQLGRLGIPFSGVGSTVAGGLLQRKSGLLAELLHKGGDANLDLWLEVVEGFEEPVALLLGLRVLSIARIRDLAKLSRRDPRVLRGVPLPLAGRILESQDTGAAGEGKARLASSAVSLAIDAARVLVDVLDGWPATLAPAGHLDRTRRLFDALGWELGDGFAGEISTVARDLAGEFPAGMEVTAEEWSSELAGRLRTLGDEPIGGRGGGVQLLTVMEARARTFDRLIVCGLDRGEFPRQVVDDPMMPDAVRARLALDVLPEMPVKARSADEERYLFAQLLSSAAASVELSWHTSAEGRRTAASPFVDRLRTARREIDCAIAAPLWSPTGTTAGPRPAYEHAVLAAVYGSRNALETALTSAIVEAGETDPTAAAPVASGRLEVIDGVEVEEGSARPGPWSGFVGVALAPDDRLWITHLEAAATCPWRSFVTRRLGVRPLPDPHLGLPDPDPRLVGSVVHEVLDRIVCGAGVPGRTTFDEAVEGEGVTVPWPPEARLEEMLSEAAERVVYDEGLGGFGLVGLLKASARPVLAVAREIEWMGGGAHSEVLAAEVEGELLAEANGRRIRFRADRLDRGPRATDYKTGKPLSAAKTPETREKHLLQKVAAGRLLQAAAYSLAEADGIGRYVYLKPKIGEAPADARVVEASGADEELSGAFHEAVATIDLGLMTGIAFPRTDEPKGRRAEHCTFCPVSEACRRDDSTFRRDLIWLMEEGPAPTDTSLMIARRLWWLGVDAEQAK